MNTNINDWKVSLIKSSATHTNGTTITFDNNEITNIDRLPSSVTVHDLSELLKSAEDAYMTAKNRRSEKKIPVISIENGVSNIEINSQRPRKPTLSLSKKS